jgi:hypothetical protein
MGPAQGSIGPKRDFPPHGQRRETIHDRERRFVMPQNDKSQRPLPSFIERLAEMLAATDRFVGWWGAHRAWPANECPRIGRCR